MGWACGAYGWGEGVYRVLVGKPEGRRPLGRPRRRWVDNIRMDLQEVGCGYVDWIGLTQDRDSWWWTLVSAAMNLRVPWNAGNFLTSCKPVSFSRRTLHHGVSKCSSSGRLVPTCNFMVLFSCIHINRLVDSRMCLLLHGYTTMHGSRNVHCGIPCTVINSYNKSN